MKFLNLKTFRAVIFDLDGVLVDSMPHHITAWQDVFRSLGVHLPSEIIRQHEGEKAKITIRRFAEQHGMALTEDQLERLIEKKREIYRRLAQPGLRPIARQAVDWVRAQGRKTAIVTGSVRPNLDWTLSPDEQKLFDVIITSEECDQGKPHPEPYLRAAKELGVAPHDCLVIENAPLGIRSAKAAGMTCLALRTTLPEEDLLEADDCIPDIDQLWTQSTQNSQ